MPFVEVFTAKLLPEKKAKLLTLVQSAVAETISARESTVTVWL